MDISSPFFVVSLIVVVFFASIFYSTSSKEDAPAGEAAHSGSPQAH